MANVKDLIVNGDSRFIGKVHASEIIENGTTLTAKYSPKSHTHNYLPLSGGTLTGSINTNLGGRNGSAIGLYAGDANGSGIVIGAGGRTIIGSGESAQNLRTALGTATSNEAAEEMYVAGDQSVVVYTNCQTIANRKSFTFGSDGNLTATKFTGALAGNASTATKLATKRTITLSGDVTGSGTFDGSANLTFSTKLVNSNANFDFDAYANMTGYSYSYNKSTKVETITHNGSTFATRQNVKGSDGSWTITITCSPLNFASKKKWVKDASGNWSTADV